MRQHPIPQNILDIEFKLFTKFTIREFTYMALGVGMGGLFVYLYTIRELPALVAFPLCIITSAIGLFVGLVPINEQKADVFIRNYLVAITRPTQRVWRNEQFDEKVEDLAEQRGIVLPNTTQGSMQRGAESTQAAPSTPKIIGGQTLSAQQFVAGATAAIDQLEKEEEARITQLESLTNNIQSPPTPPENTEPIIETATAIPQAEVTNSSPEDSTTDIDSAPVAESAPIIEQVQPNPIREVLPTAPAQPIPLPAQQYVEQQGAYESVVSSAPTETVPTPTAPTVAATESSKSVGITITPETYQNYQVPVDNFAPLPNSMNIVLLDSSNQAVPQAMAMVKDASGKLVQVYQSDQNGFVLSKPLSNGNYKVHLQKDGYTFPDIEFILSGVTYPVVRVTPKENQS